MVGNKSFGPLSLHTGGSLTVPRLLLFFRKDEPSAVAHTVDFWRGSGVLDVVPWKHSGDGKWALHINLEPLHKEGEEAYIPLPWSRGKPSVAEAVSLYREMRVTYGQ